MHAASRYFWSGKSSKYFPIQKHESNFNYYRAMNGNKKKKYIGVRERVCVCVKLSGRFVKKMTIFRFKKCTRVSFH